MTYYRAEFGVSAGMRATGRLFLRFKAVDYKAHVFVNGAYLGSHEGFFAPFELDFTACAREGANTLVVKVENDYIASGTTTRRRRQEGSFTRATRSTPPPASATTSRCTAGTTARPAWASARVCGRGPAATCTCATCSCGPLPEEDRAEAWIEVTSARRGQFDVLIDISLFGENFPKTVFAGRAIARGAADASGRGDVPDKHALAAIAVARGARRQPVPRPAFDVAVPAPVEPDEPWLYQLQVRLRRRRDRARHREPVFGMRTFRMDERRAAEGAVLPQRPARSACAAPTRWASSSRT